jgi:hypothetical protein
MNKLAAIAPTAALLCVFAAPAHAEWRLDEGVAIIEPTETNSNVELLALSCGDPIQMEVYARGGPVMPDGQEAPADYFNAPGKIEAVIDGEVFPLAAGGSDSAVVLFQEGQKAEGYLDPLGPFFLERIKSGKSLTLRFDILPAGGADGSALETFATFPLDGSRAVLDKAFESCKP